MSQRGRTLSWIAVVLATAFGIGYLTRPEGQRADNTARSYFRTTPDGVAAVARTIERLGRPAAPRITPLVEADPVRGTMALISAPHFPSPREVNALLDRVRTGGALLYVPPYMPTEDSAFVTPLMDSLALRHRPWSTNEMIRSYGLEDPRWHDDPLVGTLGDPSRPERGLRVEDADGATPPFTVHTGNS